MQRCLLTSDVIGRRTALEVQSPNGSGLLVPAGARLGMHDVQALASRGVRQVFLQDELFPEFVENHTLPVTVHLQAQAALRRLTAALEAPGDAPPMAGMRELMRSVRHLVDEIVAADDGVGDFAPWQGGPPDRVEHVVDVAAISVQIGHFMGLPRDQLQRLCVGALLMDLGLAHVPAEALQRPGPLDAPAVAAILGHPRDGWQMVHRSLPSVLPTSASVVLQHHERVDGSGYPEGRQGPDIYIFARIVAAADVFAAIRSDRPHRRRFRPAEILRQLREEAGTGLDRQVCEILLEHVAIVQSGAISRLSDGSLAKVVAHSIGAPLQPLCVVVGSAFDQPVRRRQVSLRGTNIFVDEILQAWPQSLVDAVQGDLSRV